VRRVPWDVPVRLVGTTDPATADRGAVTTRQVALAVALPGIAALQVTTSEVEGTTFLDRIDPIVTDAGRAPAEADLTLADVLDDLRADDGAVPVRVASGAFAHAVLAALCRVPAGQRCTYTELAQAAGRPRAVRAAATVMARNTVPLVLPCHRVVPSGGGVGRYGWGADVKDALLAVEAA